MRLGARPIGLEPRRVSQQFPWEPAAGHLWPVLRWLLVPLVVSRTTRGVAVIEDMVGHAGFRIEHRDKGYMRGPKAMTFMYEGSARPEWSTPATDPTKAATMFHGYRRRGATQSPGRPPNNAESTTDASGRVLYFA